MRSMWVMECIVHARVLTPVMTHATDSRAEPMPATEPKDPWPALFALCLGFFMILVDSTIVSVATPAIVEDLRTDVNNVVWVTSAYLLAYAVPVLITGRLGDRFGPKRLYLAGLTVFTLASLWCGLTGSIEGLIVARVVQGLGASMITPQTMAIITRIFPAARRGAAMALWGATAGVATLVGPILGGVLVDGLGWEWIFFVNVPVGLLAFVLAWRLVPTLTTNNHSFDWLGVALSGVGHVPAGLRHPGGPPVRVEQLGLALHRLRPRGPRPVPALAGAQQARAARAARAVRGPQLLPRERRDHGHGLRDHRDGDPDHDLGAGRPRLEPDRVGAAAGADGADDDRAGPPRRRASPTGCTRACSPASASPRSSPRWCGSRRG